MQHKIQTFRAATLNEAMDLVRQELGQNAIVVETKEVATRRLLPWPSTRQEIEVSAERGQKQSRTKRHSETKSVAAPRTIHTLAEKMSKPGPAPALFAPMAELPIEIHEDEIVQPEKLVAPLNERSSSSNPVSFTITKAKQPNRTATKDSEGSIDHESLRTLIAQFERHLRPQQINDVPSELFQHYIRLTSADVDEVIALELITKLRRQSPAEMLNSPSTVDTMLMALVEREMRCAPPIQPKPGRREIATLVGPTGVGKTTTLAKLAGHFHLNEGLRIGLITVDTYRVGAVEQLQTYAEILQIPLRTASNTDELRIAIDELDDVDLILIDTAGRSPLDEGKMSELRDFVRVASSSHVLLVLSLATSPKMLSRIASEFAIASPTSLVLTKLDEMIGGGGLLSVARDIPHPVSYFTTGQDVPDHIEPAHPSRLAKLILGREQVKSKFRPTASSS